MTAPMPLIEALTAYIGEDLTPFHMPGHKGGKGFSMFFQQHLPSMDQTEVPGLDNLHGPQGAIRQAQQLAAKAFCSDACFFLVNGSSAGIQGMLQAAAVPGEKLLIPRNAHKSIWDGLVMTGARPVYLQPELDASQGLAGQITAAQVHQALQQHPDVKGLLLVHPNYYGMGGDVHGIAAVLQDHGKLLLVDEAHGAHFPFHPALPPSASATGADAWVQSAHKTLPALTQSAYLHLRNGRINADRLAAALRMVQSTSPSYLLMASLDYARAYMETEGFDRLDQVIAHLFLVRKSLEDLGIGAHTRYNGSSICWMDPTRLVLDVSELGCTGFEAEGILRAHGVQPEMSDLSRVVCICTVADTEASFERLIAACRALAGPRRPHRKMQDLSISWGIPEQVLTPREAFYRPWEWTMLERAEGRICAGLVGTYPPGIPRYCPGERMDKAGIEELLHLRRQGARLFGLDEAGCVPIVQEPKE